MLILHETYDHWSIAVLTVTVHYSFFPTFDFLRKYVACCTGFNLLTPIFLLPYIIMDLPIFDLAVNVSARWLPSTVCAWAKNYSLSCFGRLDVTSVFFVQFLRQQLHILCSGLFCVERSFFGIQHPVSWDSALGQFTFGSFFYTVIFIYLFKTTSFVLAFCCREIIINSIQFKKFCQ